jgi:hypothetical protein
MNIECVCGCETDHTHFPFDVSGGQTHFHFMARLCFFQCRRVHTVNLRVKVYLHEEQPQMKKNY